MLDAALQLITRQGAEALTLRGAARRAGVSQAAPYRHFADKRALLAGVAEEGFRALTAAMRGAMAASDQNPLSRFRALGLAYVDFAVAHPAQFRVMFGRETADKEPYATLRDTAAETLGLLVAALEECQRAALARAGEPGELAVSAWAMVHGLSSLVLDGQLGAPTRERVEQLAHAVTAILFLGLGPERP